MTFREFLLEEKENLVTRNLMKVARYFDNFEDFKKNFLIDLNHGKYWHFTDNPNFSVSGEIGPRDMSSMGKGNISQKGALMITSDFENWDEYYNKGEDKNSRPFVALLDLSDIHPSEIKQVSRGFGNEVYLKPEQASKVKVIGIYPIQKARSIERKLDSFVPQSEIELQDLYNQAHKNF